MYRERTEIDFLVGCHSDKDLVKRIMKGYNTLVRRLNGLLSEREKWTMQTNKG